MGALFGGGDKPAPVKPVRMPVANDIADRNAAARERRNIGERSGRSSTIMTRPNGATAGTTAYTNSLLGQAI